MKRSLVIGGVIGVAAAAATIFLLAPKSQPDNTPPPDWAFTVAPLAKPTVKAAAPDDTVLRLPGTDVTFTKAQMNRFHAPDWRPGDHPPMPPVVAFGHKPDVFACGYCHLPNGQGRPENASLAGQPADYIIQQITEFKEGRRRSSQPRMAPPKAMATLAGHLEPGDLKQAAAYFSSLIYRPWIRVVEADTVPKMKVDGTSMNVPVAGGGTEPLGRRILETAEDKARTDLRDPGIGFIDYVPMGAVARGQKLAESGGGGQPCRACHGPRLTGMAGTPALRGRSPIYLVRQMFDIRHGARNGPAVSAMRSEVAHFSLDDMTDLAAYLGSLKP